MDNFLQNYSFSKRFTELSYDDKSKIIDIGELVFFNGLKWYKTEEYEKDQYAFDKRLNDMKLNTEKTIEVHSKLVETQYENILDGKEKYIVSKQNEIDELKVRINKLEDENCQALTLS